jgi:hypothetical protein
MKLYAFKALCAFTTLYGYIMCFYEAAPLYDVFAKLCAYMCAFIMIRPLYGLFYNALCLYCVLLQCFVLI